ncbi:hypothetical protein [Bradyrhizobium jicamae]|uniref:hypothetical protein n=1 Tax=Bradyrhizobium jicamae TaxID=280332 RepID=UPI001BAD1E4B|nr:hypothetical protein [Bradyrhizobium jicamae]MBR0936990.1 hypothetical protein [Bradyrhizobium jicamae]
MIFYHFTAGPFLRGISRYGLTVGDVPTDIDRWKGRIGVWLTTSQEPDGYGLAGSSHPKEQYRLSVRVPDHSPLLVKWTDWASRHVTTETISLLHQTADSFESWYVYFGVIPPASIVRCVNAFTCTTLANWGEASPPEFDVPGVPPWRRDAWQRKMLASVLKATRQTKMNA